MATSNVGTLYQIRQASTSDIPTLVKHNRWMYEEDAMLHNEALNLMDLEVMEREYAVYLEKKFAKGTSVAWVVEADSNIAASCVLSLLEWPPTIKFGTRALLHSVYTVKNHRRRGLARLMIQKAIEYCRAHNCNRLVLHASDVALKFYESMGFAPTNEMGINL
jgi:GNAT superfamily N-acetyltransferase